MERPRYIAVEGPIGVGKTALARILAERLEGRLVLEQVDENPFLRGFYADRQKHAFQAQLFFLLSRFQQQQALFQQDLFSRSTVADYLFAKDRIFAAVTLDPDELALYRQIHDLLQPRIVRPDLVIYLQARVEVLAARVRKGGRDYERGVETGHLEALAKAYNDFFFHYEETPLLVVNTSDIDLEGNPEDLEALLAVVRKHRKGTQHYVPLGTRAY
ncbi:deoxynucleoside kinase [Anaeromyxobacter oryzisoli]|uniref:deoxynucleoside kinase n=1 Tax=Anaeromyxobacter oryzisoli TaxID=2925408 RepID=UPI001F57331D|nr:deoxynucleoside kinase [Anaeromyxobacter sp. SG63]